MSGLRTRLERLEARVAAARCVWLYAGWKHRGGLTAAGDGVYRLFVPTLPPSLPPGLLVILRHPGGADVGAAAATWALEQLAPGPRQRALVAAAKILVLITAGGPAPPPEDDGEALPGAAAGPPPAAEGPSPPAVEGPPPPAAASPPPVPPQ